MTKPKLKAKMKMKPLSRLANKPKGAVHKIEITPAQHSDGSPAYTTMIHRHRDPAAQAAMDAGGNYTPDPAPEETQHPDYPDAVSHMGKALGVPSSQMPGEPGDEDEE
jgi:hypothetical protein